MSKRKLLYLLGDLVGEAQWGCLLCKLIILSNVLHRRDKWDGKRRYF